MSAVQPILDHSQHSYTLEGKPLVSVSKVIYALIKKSFDGVNEAILKSAADRGMRLEAYGTELLKHGTVTTDPDERQDVLDRLECLERWWLYARPQLIDAQRIVWCDVERTAGTLDWLLWMNGKKYIVDLKATSQAEKTWILQLGAYYSMLTESVDGLAILHINPKYSDGYMWREFDPIKAAACWKRALNWYRVLQELKAEAASEPE